MKPLRSWIIALLVVLLPLRGAIAASMLCGTAGLPGPAAPVNGMEHCAQHAAALAAPSAQTYPAATAEAPAAASADVSVPVDASAQAGGAKCNLCVAFGSVTPPVPSVASLPLPPALSSQPYPALRAPPASFIAGGPERPPRSA